MRGHIEFAYDSSNDVVIATPHWSIETETDCKLWLDQYQLGLAKLGKRKVDMVMVLDDFSITPSIAPVWGRYRATMVNDHVRFSVRVNATRRVMIASHTSSVLHQTAAAEEANSLAEAIEKIARQRASAL